jgi:hypothetical protein
MESSLFFRLRKLKKGFLIISFAFVVSMSERFDSNGHFYSSCRGQTELCKEKAQWSQP